MAERGRAEGKILKQEVEQPAEISIGFISIFPIVGFFPAFTLCWKLRTLAAETIPDEKIVLFTFLNIYYGIRRGWRVGVGGWGGVGQCIKIEELMGFSGFHSTLRSERENAESS